MRLQSENKNRSRLTRKVISVHSAIPDIQVSHLSGSYESLCRHSHFGGGERLLPLQPNAYLRPGADD
ncbi:hypothetical protein B0G81_8363 [Paraburkholderia sp. BL6665CI2N2]|nr:hypothetical protein B0G81_8363 [Paraburkholderia sp. BL6665CI2N2]